MTDFSFLTGFFKKPRTGTTPRQPPAPVAEMGSRATLPSTVNLRVPAERRPVLPEEGRGPVVAPVVPPQGLQPEQLERDAYQEKGISIKDIDLNRPFQAGDPSHSPSNPSAKGKEKQDLGETSRGEHIRSLHEQSLNAGELPDDHPMKQEEGSLLHASFLVVLAHGRMLIEQLIDYLETQTPTDKFPDNWWNELENQLMGNRHFLKRNGLFTIYEDLSDQPPSKRQKMEPSVVIGGQDKNLAERSHGMSTKTEVQERTPPLRLAVRTPRQPKPSDEDIDWTPSMENQELGANVTKSSCWRAAPREGRRGPFQRQRVSQPEARNSSSSARPLPIATKECAEISDSIWRCKSDALEGELYCAEHMRRNLREQ